MSKVDIDVKALANRLEKADCWKNEYSWGAQATKWLHLDPVDVSLAVAILRGISNNEK